MLINFFACNFSDANEWNVGTDEEPDYQWKYYCDHPESETRSCNLNNKYCGEEDDCKLLDKN